MIVTQQVLSLVILQRPTAVAPIRPLPTAYEDLPIVCMASIETDIKEPAREELFGYAVSENAGSSYRRDHDAVARRIIP